MSRHWKIPINENAIVPNWVYYVEVCGFTFRFHSVEQIEFYLAYYQQKIHPSSADGSYRPNQYYIVAENGESLLQNYRGDHWERQSSFDKLPLYLREEPKRLKVVKALEKALKQWRAEIE